MKDIFYIFAISILTLTCSKDNPVEAENANTENKIPIVVFSMNKSVADKGEIINFTNNTQNAISYLWDFGDGNTSTEINPNHHYDSSGIKSITLKAINEDGYATVTREILIKEFTVMTYNIALGGGAIPQVIDIAKANGHTAYLDNRLSDILSVIRYVNPDILGLQETFLWDSFDPQFYKQVADSLNMPYYHYLEYEQAEWNDICIYSKYPITPIDFLSHQHCVTNGVWNGTYMVKVILKMDNNEILDVLVCHLLGDVTGVQDCEIRTLALYLQSTYNNNTILMGDMNFSSNQYKNFRELTKDYIYNLFPKGFSGRTGDQIWASPNLFGQSKVYDIFNSDELFDSSILGLLPIASDHQPTIAYFGFE